MTPTKTAEVRRVDKGPAFGVRHIQVIFMFFLYLFMYGTRYSFSVALVAMTQRTTPNPEIQIYNWTNTGILLSTFFWGYVIPQIPIGILGTKFGTKYFLLAAVFMNSMASLWIPTMAEKVGIEGVAVCRVIQGFAQGLVIPSVHGLLGKWAPTNERSSLYGITVVGSILGTIAGLSSTGFICASWAGWPLSFYILPSLSMVWIVLYYFYGAGCPADHSSITAAEKAYIENSLHSQNMRNVAIPFRAIFTSVPFLATVFMFLCSGWGFAIFFTELPIYMNKVMHFDIRSNGVLSSLPHVCNMCVGMTIAVVSDKMISKNYLSVGATRKIMSSAGSIGCAILLFILAFMPTTYRALSVVVLMLAASFRSLNGAGFNINHLDLAPNFGSTLMGLTNTAGELLSLATPIAIQFMVPDESNQYLWRRVFFTAVGLYLFSTLIFVIFASGERQWWNYIEKVPEDEEQPITGRTIEEERLS
ncbi:putative inorganic phosphate cotransporter isoform X1 [Diabrotica undecimpunctata]|uniref:putative inorganic phosphate cotransporter isoform X1 n=1 Tax=Diabrotica undecimpunctata TaxID=50387 RepID=UPI003B6375AA